MEPKAQVLRREADQEAEDKRVWGIARDSLVAIDKEASGEGANLNSLRIVLRRKTSASISS
ncbi:hypothetical protein R6Q57_010938 [Mikania cordata]